MRLREDIFIIFVLFFVTFICYGAVLNAGFIWDDEFLVIQNPLVRAPLWSFQTFKQDVTNSSFNYSIYYRPLQILSYAVDYRMWGMKPHGFHVSSVFFHFLNGVLVFLLTQKLCGNKSLSLLTALLFAINPMHVGAVSYVSGRADLLFFLFGFLSMLCFVHFKEKKNPFYLSASILFLLFSFLSKEVAVIIPFLILLMDAVVLRDRSKFKVIYHIPNFALAACYAAMHRFFFADRYGMVFDYKGIAAIVMDYLKVIRDFFVLGIAPFDLHMRRFVEATPGMTVIFLIAAGCVIFLFFYLKDKRRMLAFSLGFFGIALFPLAFVMRYFKVIAEHWMYMASFGLFLFESLIIIYFFSRWKRAGKVILFAIVYAGVVFYSAATIAQNSYWRDGVSLSDRILGFSGRDTVAMHYKAVSLIKDGRAGQSLDIMKDYTEYNRQDPRAWYIKGRVELAAGNVDVALKDFQNVIRLDPDYDNGYLGMAFVSFAKERPEEGIGYLEQVVRINPRHTEALILLGTAYSKSGNHSKALEVMKSAKRSNPYDYNVLVSLGTAYTRDGNVQEGARQYLKALRLYPEKAKPCYNLGYLFYESGQEGLAIEYLQEALEREPDFKPALELLREIRRTAGK